MQQTGNLWHARKRAIWGYSCFRATYCTTRHILSAPPNLQAYKLIPKPRPIAIRRWFTGFALAGTALAFGSIAYTGGALILESNPTELDYKLKQAESFFDVVDTLGGPRADKLTHSELRNPVSVRKHYLFRFELRRTEGQWLSRVSFWPWTYDTHVYLTYDVFEPKRGGRKEKVAEVQVDGIVKRGGSYAREQGTHSVVMSDSPEGEKLVTPLWYPRPTVEVGISLLPREIYWHGTESHQPTYVLPPVKKW